MREQALRIGRTGATDRERRNLLREYLQHVLLRSLFDERLLGEIVFHGGTALRILHDLARFSEDLDFHTLAGAGTPGGGAGSTGKEASAAEEGTGVTRERASAVDEGTDVTREGASAVDEGTDVTRDGASAVDEGTGVTRERASVADDGARSSAGSFDLGDHLDGVVSKIESGGYRVDTKPRMQGNVQSCMFRFPELLYECDLSPRPEEKLSIRLEIDRRPPAGFTIERSPVDRYFPFVVVHHDRPTFLAGKLHALLQRPFAKGRDYYDVMFYLQRWPEVAPNLEYLNAALRQTGYQGEPVTEASWKGLVAERVREVDWAAIERDIAPFILRAGDLDAFEREFLLRLL
jgi:hypothetical protein